MKPRDFDAWHAYLHDRLKTPHGWGANDCVKFGWGAAKALTGDDLQKRFGRDWTSHKGAVRVLRSVGGIEAGMDTLLPRTPCAHAHRGDLGLVETPVYGPTLVVIEGTHVCAPGPRGLVRVQRSELKAAWSLG